MVTLKTLLFQFNSQYDPPINLLENVQLNLTVFCFVKFTNKFKLIDLIRDVGSYIADCRLIYSYIDSSCVIDSIISLFEQFSILISRIEKYPKNLLTLSYFFSDETIQIQTNKAKRRQRVLLQEAVPPEPRLAKCAI